MGPCSNNCKFHELRYLRICAMVMHDMAALSHEAWDGTLSSQQFHTSALHLISTWQHRCPYLPQWVLQPSPDIACGYLVLEDVEVSTHYKDDVETLDESDEEDYEPEDQATMLGCSVGDRERHWYTYHVVYNESYRVPMLFLRSRLPDGRPLQWDGVIRDLPVGSQEFSKQNRWTFLTQEDHPVLKRPWFALHPCGTKDIMSLVFSDSGPEPQKIASCDTETPEELSDLSELLKKQSPHEFEDKGIEGLPLEEKEEFGGAIRSVHSGESHSNGVGEVLEMEIRKCVRDSPGRAQQEDPAQPLPLFFGQPRLGAARKKQVL